MPLQYIIDGYNIINHITFTPIRKKIKDPHKALLEFLKHRRFSKNPKSKIIVVFDGYPEVSAQKFEEADIDVVFSREESADARIKRLVEAAKDPGNLAVVSDDREVQSFIKSCGCRAISVEGFINPPKRAQAKNVDQIKPELNYSQINKINQELKKLWIYKGR